MTYKELSASRRQIFDTMSKAIDSYRTDVTTCIESYKTKRDATKLDVEKYRASDQMYLDALRVMIPATRTVIKAKSDDLREALVKLADKMHENLIDAIITPCPKSVENLCRLYREGGITPSRTELEALSILAEGNLTAFRLIDTVLHESGSSFRLENRSVIQMEQDIVDVRKFARTLQIVPWIPLDNLHETVELFAPIVSSDIVPNAEGIGDILQNTVEFSGENRMTYVNGKLLDTHSKWDRVTLAAGIGEMDAQHSRIEEISQAWKNFSQFPEVYEDHEQELVEKGVEYGKAKAEARATAEAVTAEYAQ